MKTIGLVCAVALWWLAEPSGWAATVFSDDFTGVNGDPLDGSKWTNTSMDGSGGTIQDNMARLYSTVQWRQAQLTSTTGADFFSPGAAAMYRVDYHLGYGDCLYGWRTMDVAGASRRLVLEWTNEPWDTHFYLYTCNMDYSYNGVGRVNLWEGVRGTTWGDDGQTLSITLTPTEYSLDLIASTVSGSTTGTHGLNASDFPDGGFLVITTRKNASDEYISFDNAMIDYVPEPATLGLLALGGLARRRQT